MTSYQMFQVQVSRYDSIRSIDQKNTEKNKRSLSLDDIDKPTPLSATSYCKIIHNLFLIIAELNEMRFHAFW